MFLYLNVYVYLPKHSRYLTTANETCRPHPRHDPKAYCVHDGDKDVWEEGGTALKMKSSSEVPAESVAMMGASQCQSESGSGLGIANTGLRLCKGVSFDAYNSTVQPHRLANSSTDSLSITHQQNIPLCHRCYAYDHVSMNTTRIREHRNDRSYSDSLPPLRSIERGDSAGNFADRFASSSWRRRSCGGRRRSVDECG
jgi:hypothetical protein